MSVQDVIRAVNSHKQSQTATLQIVDRNILVKASLGNIIPRFSPCSLLRCPLALPAHIAWPQFIRVDCRKSFSFTLLFSISFHSQPGKLICPVSPLHAAMDSDLSRFDGESVGDSQVVS